jgi:hypothetical protein
MSNLEEIEETGPFWMNPVSKHGTQGEICGCLFLVAGCFEFLVHNLYGRAATWPDI